MENLNLDKFLQGGQGAFLKAADIAGEKVKAVVIGVREVDLPNSGPTIVLDVEVKKKPFGFPLNLTNLKRMIELHTSATSKWVGQAVTFRKVVVTNPKTRKEVESLRIK